MPTLDSRSDVARSKKSGPARRSFPAKSSTNPRETKSIHDAQNSRRTLTFESQISRIFPPLRLRDLRRGKMNWNVSFSLSQELKLSDIKRGNFTANVCALWSSINYPKARPETRFTSHIYYRGFTIVSDFGVLVSYGCRPLVQGMGFSTLTRPPGLAGLLLPPRRI